MPSTDHAASQNLKPNPPENAQLQTGHLWLGATCLFLATFINLLDATVVNIALPAIGTDLQADGAALQWVLSIYLLPFATCLLPFGRLGDLYGRRRMFLIGLLCFTLSSLACALAWSPATLIVTRLLQGLTAALMVPQVLAIIHATFPPDKKGKAIGLYGLVAGLGAVTGPIIGGFLISANFLDLGWRLVFLVNLPIGVLAFVGTLLFVGQTPRAKTNSNSGNKTHPGKAIDWTGSFFFIAAVASLTFPLLEGPQLNWPLWLQATFLLPLVFGIAFYKQQKRNHHRDLPQTVPLSLLTDRIFLGDIGLITLVFTGIAGTIVTLSVALQTGLGFPPAQTGLALVTHPLFAMIAASTSGRLGERALGPRILAGSLSLLIGMVWLRFNVPQTSDSMAAASPLSFALPLAFIGTGIGLSMTAIFQKGLGRVASHDAGAGSGLLQSFQQIGIILGIALIGHLYFVTAGTDASPQTTMEALSTALCLPIAIYTATSLIAALRLRN